MSAPLERIIDYPAELTVKAVFRNSDNTRESIEFLYRGMGLDLTINSARSSGGKFISYTITATYPSGADLKSACAKVSTLKDFMTMF